MVYCRTFFVVYVAVFGFHSVLLIYYNKTAENVNDGKKVILDSNKNTKKTETSKNKKIERSAAFCK